MATVYKIVQFNLSPTREELKYLRATSEIHNIYIPASSQSIKLDLTEAINLRGALQNALHETEEQRRIRAELFTVLSDALVGIVC
jgi:hypothetical protein